MCPCDTWTMENVTHGKMNSRVRGSFLSLEGNQTIWWGRGEEKKREKEREKKREIGAVRDTRERRKRPAVLFKISGLPTVQTRRSKRQSWFMR